MALEDFCLLSGILFLLVYVLTLAASLSIVFQQRKRDLILHRIRCNAKSKMQFATLTSKLPDIKR
jgi:hypothetical protein